MQFSKQDVLAACRRTAPRHSFDPLLVYAVCKQESAHDAAGNFLADIGRPEPGFYPRYVEKKFDLATTSELLLSCSFGVMQLMGESLIEMDFFEWRYSQLNQGTKDLFKDPRSEFAIPNALNWFCVNLDVMVEYGCKWLARKRDLASGDTDKMLLYYNGGSNKSYNLEVRAKWDLAKSGTL